VLQVLDDGMQRRWRRLARPELTMLRRLVVEVRRLRRLRDIGGRAPLLLLTHLDDLRREADRDPLDPIRRDTEARLRKGPEPQEHPLTSRLDALRSHGIALHVALKVT